MQIKNGSLVTKKLLRAWGACWDDARIDEFLQGIGKRVRGLSIESVLRDSRITLSDRLWVGTKYLEAVDPQACRLFAIECAMSVAKYAGDEDAVENHLAMCSWQYEIELYYAAEDKSAARSAAESAAESAASSAARNAAWSAAYSAARSAASSAAESAARSAASSAAESAASSAAESAARSAAESAAESAARSAARSAAWSAAYSDSAARSAALEGYIDNLLAWLTVYPENL